MPTIDTAFVLLVVTVLLAVVGLCQPLAARLKLPPPVLLAVVGVALGGFPVLVAHLGSAPGADVFVQAFSTFPVDSTTFIYVFLPLLLFEAGITTDVRRMIEDAAPILLLAIIATLVTSAVVGCALWPFASVPLVVCLLVGAVVATTDPAAVIAIFRDVGAPGRLTRLVEGEALLNDAAAIALFAVLLGMILAAREPDIGSGLREFFLSFAGGGLLGLFAGRALLSIIPWVSEDRLAESTLTLALAYGVFIAADRLFHVSGVVAVLGAGLTVSALGRSRIAPENWAFLSNLWDQIAFWARSLIFMLASILVPRLLSHVDLRDLGLLAVLIAAAFAARIVVLFGLMPPLEYFRLTQPINAAYKLAMVWGGLRGALTLVLALSVTENSSLDPRIQRFIAVLATGFVVFTLFVNGTTLRLVISFLGLDRLSPRAEVLRDRILALSYREVCDTVRRLAEEHALAPAAVEKIVEPYQNWITAANVRDAAERLTERDRLAVALVALANQERALALEIRAGRIAPPAIVQMLLHNAETLIDGARSDGRLGYQRAADAVLDFPLAFRIAYSLYRYTGIQRLLADRLADRVELLLMTRVLLDRLAGFADERLRPVFGERITDITGEITERRRRDLADAFDALRRQYPDYVAALEMRFLRQSAVRQETARYQALFDEGLIPQEIFEDLKRDVAIVRAGDRRPHFDIGLNTRQLIERLDLLSALSDAQLDRIATLLRPRFTVPDERIVRAGARGDSVFFIASGAVEVSLPRRRVRLGSGEFFGEMALLTGQPRQADVVALSYCRLLVLQKSDFDRFVRANPDAGTAINRVAQARLAMNRADSDQAAEAV
jgi:CPA1 family monovalent cation:H+ antiporter